MARQAVNQNQNLEGLGKPELTALAADRGVEIKKSWSRTKIIDAINAKAPVEGKQAKKTAVAVLGDNEK